MVKISAALTKQLTKRQMPHKYNAKRTTCLYGHDHDSKKEAMWCLKLTEMEKEGKISKLVQQPKFELIVHGIHIADHYPDFGYYVFRGEIKDDTVYPLGVIIEEPRFRQCIVEVKGDWAGSRLPVWKLKHRLFVALYPNIE